MLIDINHLLNKHTWPLTKDQTLYLNHSRNSNTMWLHNKYYIKVRQISYHCAILKQSNIDWKPKLFKTFNVWNKEPWFNDMIKDKGNSYNVRGNALVVVKQKL